jgi:hypothetical protein
MITSKNTSINKNKVPKLFTIVDKHYGWKKGTKNFDLGGGKYDTATMWLKKKGVKNLIYDPYNRDWNWNCNTLSTAERSGVGTVTVSNVLNVLKGKEKKDFALFTAERYLKKGGIVYISVYEGNKSGKGKMTKKDCWQENKTLKAYLPMVRRYFKNARIEHGIIIATKER